MKISTLFKKGLVLLPALCILSFFAACSADSGSRSGHTGTYEAADLTLLNQEMQNDPDLAGSPYTVSVDRLTLTLNADNSCSMSMTMTITDGNTSVSLTGSYYGSYTYQSGTVTIGVMTISSGNTNETIDLSSTPLQYEDGKLVYEENGVRETVFVKS